MKNSLLTILLFGSMLSFGQQKNHFSFTIGSALPLGKFKLSDINNIESGYAQNGRSMSISYSRSLAKQIALKLTFLSISNRLDSRPELQAYVDRVPDTKFASIQNRAWYNRSFLLGVSKKFQLFNSRFSIEPSFQSGYTHSRRPKLFISNHTDDETIPKSETGSTSSSLSLKFGVNHHFSINDQFTLFASIEYFATSAEFNFRRYLAADMNSPSVSQDISYTQDIRLLLIQMGFSYQF